MNTHSIFGDPASAGLTAAGAAVVVPNFASGIQAALGMSVDDIEASEATVVTVLADDTYSIEGSGLSGAMRDGINLVFEALSGSETADGIIAGLHTITRGCVMPYKPIADVTRFDENSFPVDGGSTPLYDRSASTLGVVVTKSKDLRDAALPHRTITLIVTDGADTCSRHHRAPEKVAPLVKDMLLAENHIVAFMGVGDAAFFRDIAKRMGIADRWILTPKDAKELRAALLMFSKSAVRASQAANAATFNAVAGGGFTS